MSQRADLEHFAALLRKWNAVQNLVSRETIDNLWPRHIEDSLQLMRLVRNSDSHVIDIGSGGGFPAIPMAIASRGTDRRFTLVEPNSKKAAFLRTVARELDLPVTVHAQRAEQIDSRETAQLITSRALAVLPKLMQYSLPFAAEQAHMIFPKGRNYRQELDAAADAYHFDVLAHPSESDAEGVLLEITNLRAKSAA
jgi:16S rRNA (guanine527-N7)-methyltransferase